MPHLRPFHAALLAVLLLAGCSGQFASDYATAISPEVSRTWRVTDVQAMVPESRTVSNDNVLVPIADIVWHGDPPGDRKAQVSAIIEEGVRAAARPLSRGRPVALHIAVDRFHGVTPAAVNVAPAAVNDIAFQIAVVDARTREVLVPATRISAPVAANTRNNAILAQRRGETERQRIVDHVAAVTAGWLGTGPDVRGSFVSMGY
jgi:hypothetical protein